MSIKSRLTKLESLPAARGERTADERWRDSYALDDWLEQHGFADHLAALEANAECPAHLVDLLHEYAAHDPRHRAWKRLSKALAAFDPNDPESVAEFRIAAALDRQCSSPSTLSLTDP